MTAALTLDAAMARVDVTEAGCWEYRAKPSNPHGYRRCGDEWAHRRFYTSFVGPIPAGYEVDHLCNNPPCVNPQHLEAVTPQENMRRARERRTVCGNGHPWDDANTAWTPRGFRSCRACCREKEARRRQRIRTGITPRSVRDDQHGTTTGYNYGCRCDRCREAFRTATVERIARRGHPQIRPEHHGTRTGYGYGCRCDDCRRCQREEGRRRRAQAKQPMRRAA